MDNTSSKTKRMLSYRVEQILQPLVDTINQLSLESSKSTNEFSHLAFSTKKKPKDIKRITQSLKITLQSFIDTALSIATENPEVGQEIKLVTEEIREVGIAFKNTTVQFLQNPLNNFHKKSFNKALQSLYAAILRLLILADLLDVRKIMDSIELLKKNVNSSKILSASEISQRFRLDKEIVTLSSLLKCRQRDILETETGNGHIINYLSLALQKSQQLFKSAQNICLQFPDSQSAEENLRFSLINVQEAADNIQSLAYKESIIISDKIEKNCPSKELIKSLETLENQVLNLKPGEIPNNTNILSTLNQNLLKIINDCRNMLYIMERNIEIPEALKNSFNQRCENLLNSFADLIETNNQKKLAEFLSHSCKWVEIVKLLLSDTVRKTFAQDIEIIDYLKNAAYRGDADGYDLAGVVFKSSINAKIDAARLACCLSLNPNRPLASLREQDNFSSTQVNVSDIREMRDEDQAILDSNECSTFIKLAAWHLDQIVKQIINAGKILTSHTKSQLALNNFEVFLGAYSWSNDLLKSSLDTLCTIPDVIQLSIDGLKTSCDKVKDYIKENNLSEAQIEADFIKCQVGRLVEFIEKQVKSNDTIFDFLNLAKTRLKIQLDQYKGAIRTIKWSTTDNAQLVQNFDQISRELTNQLESLRSYTLFQVKEEEPLECIDKTENLAFVENNHGTFGKIDDIDEPGLRMRRQIANEIGTFNEERRKFIREVTKWDDSANGIVSLAKQMCLIMQDMIEFTKGSGTFTKTTDVIQAAQNISELGAKLDKLCREIVEHCVDSASRRDLLAYLQRVTLYCHLLNITSRVKADVQNTVSASGGVSLAELDGASSLIQAAKNLMSSVVLTVKESYIASTKYRSEIPNKPGNSCRIQWKMKVPQKKPLIQENSEDDNLKINGTRRSESQLIRTHFNELNSL